MAAWVAQETTFSPQRHDFPARPFPELTKVSSKKKRSNHTWEFPYDEMHSEHHQRPHYPDKLDDYLNKILVETGQLFFKKEPMDAPGYSDLAAKRR